MSVLQDRFGRAFPYLRLSVIEACNFHCSYCLPDGFHARAGRPMPLTREEIARLLRGFASVGLRKLRLTGGEPSLRRDLPEIIASAAAVGSIDSIALTTNGTLLDRRVARWRQAGLTNLNISVDALERERFHAITGHDRLDEILRGIELAQGLGFKAIKLNAVLLKGLNDDLLPQWFDYLRERDVTVRFIELMRTGDNLAYFERHHLRAETLEANLQATGWQLLQRAPDAGPAREYAHPDFAGRIGVIAPYSNDFCAGCNRLRVTHTGDLRLCLFGNVGIPLRPWLQDDADCDRLAAALQAQLGLKAIGHRLHEGETGLVPNLSTIGG
ncbi:GTP 3',8-cyclase MoaA [Thermomonas sp. HDW16]|uniref:GTP 3',8-cyclase MoaA n=1 Tax=Thermomonas sp. HDW16 TaxID=2714945 RepID=UPI00140A8464|nr:GTP 3',8-cyclase MoaA [Thermomonas sp. HDW16]QIL20327.1 GTP 3',8-cyclase MoaA [Thermomonas sp. HDW16]